MQQNILAWSLGMLSALAAAGVEAQGRVLTVDDFEDGDRRAASGLSWISIADDLMGGASNADLQVTPGALGDPRALRVSGEIAPDGFAGAWVALDGRARATDVSDFAGIRLRVRGPGTLQVALRGGPRAGANYAAPVEARSDWTSVDVPFETLQAQRPESPAFDPRSVRWLGVGVRGPRGGRYAFELDDVGLYAVRGDARIRVVDGPTLTVPFHATEPAAVPQCAWKELATEAGDDGRQRRLPDATSVSICPDGPPDRAWFRIALAGPVPARWLGANLALDLDGDPANGMAWWGTNTAFHFDRLVTAYGSVTDSGYEGMIGIADAAEVQAGNMIGSQADAVRLFLDRAHPAFIVGIPKSALAGPGTAPVRLVAAVGSALQHNDDVPNEGAVSLAR
jgi:hypothetical protein